MVFQCPWTWPRHWTFLSQDLSAVQFSTALFYFRPWWRARDPSKRIWPCRALSLLEANVLIGKQGGKSVQLESLALAMSKWSLHLRGCSRGSTWAGIGALNWAFKSRLNGSSVEKGAEAECLLVEALEWGAEEAVSASGNESEGAKATAIDQSSSAIASTSSGYFDCGIESRSTWHSEG